MALSNGFVQNGATQPLDARMMESARFVRTASGAVRTGVLWTSGTTGNVVGSTTSMNVILIAADFLLSRSVADGAVVVTNNGSVNVAIATAPSSNSRIDVIWVKQNDSTQGDATSTAAFGATTGTAAASPTKPTIPTGALELATVLVPAGVTAMNASGVSITNTFQYAASQGSPIRYRNEVEMRADAANVVSGTSAYISNNGGMFFRRGGIWVRVDGISHVVLSGGNASLANTSDMTSITSTLGGTVSAYVSSDEAIFPTRTDSVIGPLAVAGRYEVSALVQFNASTSTGDRAVCTSINDAQAAPAVYAPGTTRGFSYTTMIACAAGDYIKFKGAQNSGSAQAYQWRFSAKLLQAS